MKTIRTLILFAVIALFYGCNKGDYHSAQSDDEGTGYVLGHDEIVLGVKLDDPYSVKNVTKALYSLYPTKAGRVDIKPTDMYVRFLPSNEIEYNYLKDLGLDMMDHPLDYQILKDGDYYIDPLLPEGSITWQYCVVPKDFALPANICHEVLDDCFIPDNSATRADWVDWEAVEAEAYRLTGNEDLLGVKTKGVRVQPKGRITIVDDKYAGGKPFGVAGVKVVCNSFVKFSSTFTDRDGYYTIPKSYSSKVRYRLMFTNEKNFSIGFNLILIPASTSALGKASPSGIDAVVTNQSERKLFCRCAVNNAAYDYITRCSSDDMNIPVPPSGLRFWIFQSTNSSSAVMLKHGAVLDKGLLKKYLGKFVKAVKVFMPDITIGLKNINEYSKIYSSVCHELAHASHFSKVGPEYWDKYIEYIITSFVTSGGVTYGDGTGTLAGYCEIGEMWGYFMQNKMFKDRYGGKMPTAGMNYWFKPQIFRYLYERGISVSKICAAMTKDVADKEALKRKLIAMNPGDASIVELVFRRYAE